MPLRNSPVWFWIPFLIPFSSFRFWIPFADSTFWGCLFFILNWMNIARLNWINTIKMNLLKWGLNWLLNYANSEHCYILQGRPRGVVVYQYTRKKFAKIPQNTPNWSKYTQNYTQVYFTPEIQRKWYTAYPYLSCNIPYTRFKKPLYIPYTQKPWPTLILACHGSCKTQ